MHDTLPDSADSADTPESASPALPPPVAQPTEASEVPEALEATQVEQTAAAPAPAAPRMSLDECAAQLRTRFPALFAGQAKPIKLHIQADIQIRAPGVFTKQVLSAFFRRHTGSRGYLLALTRAPHRVDLDGQPAGEVAEVHRLAAQEELKRREQTFLARRQEEDDQRRDRARLLREWQTTTLTRANFCALKNVPDASLDALLERARQEAEERAAAPPMGHGPRPPRRDDRPGTRPGSQPGSGPRDGQRPRSGEGQRPRHDGPPRAPRPPKAS